MSPSRVAAAPGVSVEFPPPPGLPGLPTAVPLFLGILPEAWAPRDGDVRLLTGWSRDEVGDAPSRGGGLRGNLVPAVRGFFENGGALCGVWPMPAAVEPEKLREILGGIIDARFDLVCAPDL